MICRKCQSPNINLEYREDRQQYASRCKDCGQFTWQPKEGTKNRESKHSDIIKKIGIDYCEWCLRNRQDIPPPGTLEAHHIIEYKDGGISEPDNILILCTACHKQCHHDRTYYSHYKNRK